MKIFSKNFLYAYIGHSNATLSTLIFLLHLFPGLTLTSLCFVVWHIEFNLGQHCDHVFGPLHHGGSISGGITEESDFLSSRAHQYPLVQWGWVGPDNPFLIHDWLLADLFLHRPIADSHSCCRFFIALLGGIPRREYFTASFSLYSISCSVSLAQCSLSLRGGGINVLFRSDIGSEHSAITYSWTAVHLCIHCHFLQRGACLIKAERSTCLWR